MQTLVVDLILAAGVCAIFLIALRGGKDEKGRIKIWIASALPSAMVLSLKRYGRTLTLGRETDKNCQVSEHSAWGRHRLLRVL